jgi:hypothetical protein
MYLLIISFEAAALDYCTFAFFFLHSSTLNNGSERVSDFEIMAEFLSIDQKPNHSQTSTRAVLIYHTIHIDRSSRTRTHRQNSFVPAKHAGGRGPAAGAAAGAPPSPSSDARRITSTITTTTTTTTTAAPPVVVLLVLLLLLLLLPPLHQAPWRTGDPEALDRGRNGGRGGGGCGASLGGVVRQVCLGFDRLVTWSKTDRNRIESNRIESSFCRTIRTTSQSIDRRPINYSIDRSTGVMTTDR